MRGSVLAASAAALGLALAVSACSSGGSTSAPPTHSASPRATTSTGSTTSTSSSTSLPAGYQRVGGAAQGVSMAVPSSWISINFAQQNMRQAVQKIGLHGVSQATLTQDLNSLQKLKGVYDVDVKSVKNSPEHFATNISAYCTASGISQSGSAGVPVLRQSAASQLGQVGAENIKQTDEEIGGVPGVKTAYNLSSSAVGLLQGAQLEVLPKPDRVCFITLTAGGSFPSAVLDTVAASVQYP